MALALVDVEPAPKGAVLSRLSEEAKDGKVMTVGAQEEDQERHAARMGIPIVLRYSEDGVSGFDDIPRPNFDQLIEDVRAGRITHLFLREVERGTRRISNGGLLLEAAEKAGMAFVVDGRVLTMEDNDLELMMMLVMGNMESRKIRKRVKGSNRKVLERGLYTGRRRPFGYRRIENMQHGFFEQHPEEAQAMRDGYDMVVNHAQSTRAVAREWNARGLLTSGGVKWNGPKVQRVLEQPIAAGMQTHKRQIIRPLVMPDGSDFPAIFTADEQRVLRSVFTARARSFPSSKPHQPALLSGLLQCPHCGSRLNIHRVKDDRSKSFYACRVAECGGCSIRQGPVEDYIEALVLALMKSKRWRNAFSKPTAKRSKGEDPAKLEAELVELAQAMESPDAPPMVTYLAADKALRARLDAAYNALHEDDARRVLIPFLRGDVDRTWAKAKLDGQRTVIAALIDHVTVQPAYGRALPIEVRVPDDAIIWRE